MILLNAAVVMVTAVCIEFFLRSPFLSALSRLAALSGRTLWVLRARHVSDERKQICLMTYSARMFRQCLTILLVLAFIGLLVWLADFVAGKVGVALLDYLVSMQGIALSLLVSVIYVWARRRVMS